MSSEEKRYMEWERTDPRPGHRRIMVWCRRDGSVIEEDGKVQCSTTDRIPFKMRKRDLLNRYVHVQVERGSP